MGSGNFQVASPLSNQTNQSQLANQLGTPLAEGFSDSKSIQMFGNRAKLTLSVAKTGSSTSTSVGDKVHVDVTLEKLDMGELNGHESSMMIVPYPNEEQGFTMTQGAEINFSSAYGENTTLAPLSGSDLQTVLMFYAASRGLDLDTITGTATQTPEMGGGAGQSIFENLILTGDKITVSYESEITEAAIGKDSFTLASGFYDSAGTGDFTGDLSITLPGNKITDWNLQLDDEELSMVVDPKDSQTLIHSETGNWANYPGNKTASLAYQVDNGELQNVPSADLNQAEKTFNTSFDLSKSDQPITQDGEHTVTFFMTIDGITEEDSVLDHVTLVKNSPPTLSLSPTDVTMEQNETGVYNVTLKGLFKDADSDQVILSGNYSDNTAIALTDNTFTNENKGQDTTFSASFKTTAGKLKTGANQLTFWLKDNEGANSEMVVYTLTIVEKQNDPPKLTLDYSQVGLYESASGIYKFTIKGVWNDKDSDSVTIEGKYPDNSAIHLSNNTYSNKNKGTDTTFSLDIETEAGKLKLDSNVLKFIVVDNDKGTSEAVEFTVNIGKKPNHAPVLHVDKTNYELIRQESGTYDFTIEGLWSDQDSSTVKLQGTYKDNTTFTSDTYPNEHKGQDTPFHLTMAVPVEKLNGEGNNHIMLEAIDEEGAVSQVIMLKFTITEGTIQFEKVAETASFQPTALSLNEVISQHNNDWVVAISDTTKPANDLPTWRLEATQEAALADETTQHSLSSTIQYKQSNGEVTPLEIGVPIPIDMHQDTTDKSKYDLGWTETTGFQLPVKSSEYAGNYTTTVNWTIVEAP
ncbi:hypothetical protein IGI37_003057 [Enterococcus sp. AZ194]